MEMIIRAKCNQRGKCCAPLAVVASVEAARQWLADHAREYRCYGTDGTYRRLTRQGNDLEVVSLQQDTSLMDRSGSVPSRWRPIAEELDLVVITRENPLWSIVK